MRQVADPEIIATPAGIELPVKDAPVLAAALAAAADFLLRGDRKHFGALYGQRVLGTLVMLPGEFLYRFPSVLDTD